MSAGPNQNDRPTCVETKLGLMYVFYIMTVILYSIRVLKSCSSWKVVFVIKVLLLLHCIRL